MTTSKEIAELSGLALWQAYCEKKMMLEDAQKQILELERIVKKMQAEIQDLRQRINGAVYRLRTPDRDD